MAGYTRQDTTGQLANGNPIDADVFNDEYDAIEGAFNASTGHTHDGTAGGGAPIESIGPSQELEVTSSAVFPKVDNLIDHGKSTLQWKTGYYGTDVVVGQDVTVTRDVSVGRNLTVTGDATINGNLILGDAATDTVSFVADVSSSIKPDTAGLNLGSSTQPWENLYLDGTANVDFLTVDEDATIAGTLAVTGATSIGANFDVSTTMFTIAAATGNTAIAGTLDVTGATTLTGAVTATGGVTGDLTGDVTGDVTGNVTGDVTGDLTGDVTGNVTGNVTGDLTGDVTGNVTGNVTGDVTGNLTGNVTGDVTGNLTGNVTGDLTGDVTGNVTGNLTGNVTSTGANTMASLTTTGNIGVGGDVTVTGDLTVSGTTTTVNSTTVEVADLNLTVASNAATAAAANGGGITVGGANAQLNYDATTDRWDMNKDLEVSNVYANLTGSVDGILGGTTPAAVTGTTVQFNTSITDGTITITGFVDEDDMVSNSASLVPTQQSVKAYVDDAVAGDGTGDISASQVSVATGTGGVDLDGGSGTGWVIYQSGTDLKFKYNGVDKFSLSTAGALTVEDDVTAYGSA